MSLKISANVRKNIVIAFLVMACMLLLVATVYLFITRNNEVISEDSIREEIVPVAELTTYEYNFTHLMFLTDSGNPLNLNNPITSKRYLATIDGSIPLQVDAGQISCSIECFPDGSLQKVNVSLPHSYVGEVTLDHATAKKYVEDNGVLNQVTPEDLNNLYIEAETQQKEKVQNSDIPAHADQRVRDLIRAQIQNYHGENVEVSFEYTE